MKEDQISVKEIVRQHLIEHGFDGLCDDECGCLLYDFMPCCDPHPSCIPGYKHKATSEFGNGWGWIITPDKREEDNDEE